MIFRRLLLGQVVLATLVSAVASPAAANPALEGYANDVQFTAQVRELDRSDLVAVRSLGKSVGGREVWLLTIGTGETDKKPAIAVIGNVHGPHLAGAELAMGLAQRLARYGETDEVTKKVLAEVTFYVIPRPSPDACNKCFAQPFREREGNDRPTDDDRDFQVGEDPPDDLNGDGWITMMRIEDPAGDWLPHPADPRVQIQADRKKNERGQYRLLVEGKDDDHDEQWNEDGGDGVAFNRNLTHRYEPFAKGTGPHAVSEPEHRVIVDFLHDRSNIAAVFCFSPEDNLFHPWKANRDTENARVKTNILSADQPQLEFLAGEYKKLDGGSGAPPLPSAPGCFAEWAYFHYGRWPLAARGWWVPKVDPPKPAEGEAKKPSDDKRGADELNHLRWLDREKIDGFVAWKPIEHPDFPGKKVEVGGPKPFYSLNPPVKELDDLTEKHVKYITALPQWLPRLAIVDAKAESLGGGVVRVSATVVNQGYLPTMPEMGRVNDEAYPTWIELALPAKTALLQGHARTRLPRLEGAGGKTEHKWLVRFSDEMPVKIDIRAFAPALHGASTSIEIK